MANIACCYMCFLIVYRKKYKLWLVVYLPLVNIELKIVLLFEYVERCRNAYHTAVCMINGLWKALSFSLT